VNPPVDGLEIGQHLIQGSGVDGGIHPTGAVRGHLAPERFQAWDQGIVGIILAGDLIGGEVVLNPEGDIPGFPVCPTVEVGALGDHGGEGVHGGVVVNCDYPTASERPANPLIDQHC